MVQEVGRVSVRAERVLVLSKVVQRVDLVQRDLPSAPIPHPVLQSIFLHTLYSDFNISRFLSLSDPLLSFATASGSSITEITACARSCNDLNFTVASSLSFAKSGFDSTPACSCKCST